MVTLEFEGLCAFKGAAGKQVTVLVPEIHSHTAVMVAEADEIDLANSVAPARMFVVPGGTVFYLWELSGLSLTFGVASAAPTWAANSVIDLGVKHSGATTKTTKVLPEVHLGSGTIKPAGKACFECSGAGSATSHDMIHERAIWEGAAEVVGGHSVVTVGADTIRLKGTVGKFAISNSVPEPDGHLHFHAYYSLLTSITTAQVAVAPSKKCSVIGPLSVGSGNCVPVAIVP